MLAYKFLRLFIHLFVGMWTCAAIFPWLDRAGRERRVQQWSMQMLAICGVEPAFIGSLPPQPLPQALIVANHISWLDIFVINAVHPCHFVTKSDVRNWPLIGWLCEKTGAIFIARGSVRDVRRIFEGLVQRIRAGERVAFFPEGTTSAQGTLGPFHANLFEAAIDAGVPIQPYALRYTDVHGRLHSAADFIGDMSFAQSMVAILKAGKIQAELIRLPELATANQRRRDVAAAAQSAIATALGLVDAAYERAA